MEGDLPEELTAELKATHRGRGPRRRWSSRTPSPAPATRRGGRRRRCISQVASVVNLLTYNPYRPVRIKQDRLRDAHLARAGAPPTSRRSSWTPRPTRPARRSQATVFVRPYKGCRSGVPVTLKLPADLPEGDYTATVCDDLANVRARAARQSAPEQPAEPGPGVRRRSQVQTRPSGPTWCCACRSAARRRGAGRQVAAEPAAEHGADPRQQPPHRRPDRWAGALVSRQRRPTGSCSGSESVRFTVTPRTRSSRLGQLSLHSPSPSGESARPVGHCDPRACNSPELGLNPRPFNPEDVHAAAILFLLAAAHRPSWPLRGPRPPRSRSGTSTRPAHYDKAQLKQAVVSSEGALRLSRQLKPLADLDATHVWDVVEDKRRQPVRRHRRRGQDLQGHARRQGRGRLRQPRTARSSAWPLAPDGAVYAGTGPSGLIVRIGARRQRQGRLRQPGKLRLVAGRRRQGQDALRRHRAEGPHLPDRRPRARPSVFYTTKQEHILCLARRRRRHALRRHRQGRPGLPHRPERQGLRPLPGAAGGGPQPAGDGRRRLRRHQSPAGSRLGSGEPRFLGEPVRRHAASRDQDRESAAAAGQHARTSTPADKDKRAGDKASPPPPRRRPAAGENSLYRIAADGTVREVFREKAMMLSLLRQQRPAASSAPAWRASCSRSTKPRKERSEIARLDHGQIHCLCRARTAPSSSAPAIPGKLYVLEDRYADRGTVLSEVLDAKIVSKWGSLRWKADTPAGTRADRRGPQRQRRRAGRHLERLVGRADRSRAGDRRRARRPASLQYRVTLTTERPGRHAGAARHRRCAT